jgi:UDP-2,3-diacylglucosamine pyrophosphatase LpxH
MNRIIVISDLHIGAGDTDDCDAELEKSLIGFLSELSSQDSTVELVINGDFLDFAQAAPWEGKALESVSETGIALCFTEDQSCAKLEAIVKAHKPIFAALRDFVLARPDNRLVILPGNHDADFFWERVRSLFLDAVCDGHLSARQKIHFHLEQVYRPPQCTTAWIEHGNQYDPINSFHVKEIDIHTGQLGEPKLYWSADNPPIFKDVNGVKRLYECIGTRFLIKYINSLDADYPFVDNVKPFSRFLKIFGTSALVVGYGPIKAAAAIWGILLFLSKRFAQNPGEVMSIKKPDQAGAQAILAHLFETLSKDDQALMKKSLEEKGLQIKGSLGMYMNEPVQAQENAEKIMTILAENLDLVESFEDEDDALLSLGGGDGTLSLGEGFSIDETEELKKAVKNIIYHNEVSTVVMGHTHDPVDELKYVNTGSWTRYYQYADEEKTRPWILLKSSGFKNFPFQLNYAELILDGSAIFKSKTYK